MSDIGLNCRTGAAVLGHDGQMRKRAEALAAVDRYDQCGVGIRRQAYCRRQRIGDDEVIDRFVAAIVVVRPEDQPIARDDRVGLDQLGNFFAGRVE